MTTIYLICGHVACLKSTMANRLSHILSIPLVSTSSFGGFDRNAGKQEFNQQRESRYDAALTAVEHFTSNGHSVVVDGTFSNKKWRENLYLIALENGVSGITIVFCLASDVKQVAARMKYRREHPGVPDANSNVLDAYLESSNSFAVFNDDVVGFSSSTLIFDSTALSITVADDSPTHDRELLVTIRKLIDAGAFSTPLFIAPSCKQTKSTIIFFEGIGGTGKTTLAQKLVDEINAAKSRSAILVDEFSTGLLGKYITSMVPTNDFTVVEPSNGKTHLSTLLIVGDLLDRLEHIQTALETEYIVFDRGPCSVMAHALTIAHSFDSVELNQAIIKSLSNIIEQSSLPLQECVTYYFDIEVEQAMKRIEGREGITANDEHRLFLHRLKKSYAMIFNEFTTGEPILFDANKPEAKLLDELISSTLG